MRRLILYLLAGFLPAITLAQTNASAIAARQWRQQNERTIVDEFVDFLRLPDVTRDHADVQRNAEFIGKMMERRGLASKLVTVEGANPVVFSELKTPGAARTIVFYAHYDGQPVDPKEWSFPPFTPTLCSGPLETGGKTIPLPPKGTSFDPESRLYARAAGDDKVSIMALMAALDAIRAMGLSLKSNIKFVFDGEEELLSPNLGKIIAANVDLFSGDFWLMCDGPLHQSRRPMIYFGARDNVGLDLTVYGSRIELHSGQYGNWAPDPAMMLARLLASMKDEGGQVLVDHFYDGIEPLSDTEKRAVAEAPDNDAQLMHDLWLGSTEGAPKKLVELLTQPSLNVRGLASSRVGLQASSIIPSTAIASIGIRLVKGMDPAGTQQKVIDHIRKQGFFVVDQPPSAEIRQAHPKVVWVNRGRAGLGAVRTPMDLPISQEVIRVVESVRGPAVKLPNMGGSMPLADIERPLGTHTIIIPIANHDDNQHTFNENIRIQNLWDGIELMSAMLTM